MPSPGDLSDPGIEPSSPVVQQWQADSLPAATWEVPGILMGKSLCGDYL